jgi:hypothetical protein
MPAYSTSLACANAKIIYNPDETTYFIPFGSDADYTVSLRGGAVGTLVLAEGAADAQDIQFDMTLRTDNRALLDTVQLQYPSLEDINGGSQSRLRLNTPGVGHSCMRYDIVLRIPPTLKNLTIQSQSVTQVEFAKEAQVSLTSLVVNVQPPTSEDARDLAMVLPHANFHADTLKVVASAGWVVGEVSVVGETELHTQQGDAIANLHVQPVPHADADTAPAPAVLRTLTGSGRTDVFYESDAGAVHRPITSTHKSAKTGDVYLTYKDAGFNGRLDVKAKSYTASGVHDMFNRTSTALPWVGDKDGGDMLVVEAPNGWVGMYF